jgi:hypothetical protein
VNHEEESLTVTSLRPIKAGEEILNYYGPHPNSELLRRYGYVTERHSRYDVVEIPWDVVESVMRLNFGISGQVLEKLVCLENETNVNLLTWASVTISKRRRSLKTHLCWSVKLER